MLDKAVDDTGFLSSLVFRSWGSVDIVLVGESGVAGGVAARENLGGLLDSEKELILLLVLGAMTAELSTLMDSSSASAAAAVTGGLTSDFASGA